MAHQRVEIVPRPVKVGGDHGHVIRAELLAIGRRQARGGQFRHRIGLVGRLGAAIADARLGDRLWRAHGIHTAAAEIDQALHARRVGGIHDIGPDHQIDEQEVGRQRRIGVDAPHPRGGHDHGIGPCLGEPALDLGLARQIELLAVDREDLAVRSAESAHDGCADHAAMAGHPDALACRVENLGVHVFSGKGGGMWRVGHVRSRTAAGWHICPSCTSLRASNRVGKWRVRGF